MPIEHVANLIIVGLAALATGGGIGWRLGVRDGDKEGYDRGHKIGYDLAVEHARLTRERERINARRAHDEFQHAGYARVSQVRISHRNG